ncbi:hypothetical protein NHX12_001256 [Muraenolepis orangiensis]|uniref:Ubiquitin carboxyl-terminal hydrolase MINDY n=1 Tax=Muraenolepis orangiensis TaxID=630683 RepID=A0A9Q0DY26_9TELE|nr:hypothetical protein NHX12_001256 [Muraenolepis orangiensis]
MPPSSTERTGLANLRRARKEEQKVALCSTLSEILESACSSPSNGYCLVSWAKGQSPHTSTHAKTQTQSQSTPDPESSQPPQELQPNSMSAEHLGFERFHSVLHQSLVNLFVTGHAVSNVWDGDRECSGMNNGFIPESLLEDVMKALDLVSEPEYVSLMKSKLDPESLGIILLGPFLLEFFPDQDSGIPDSFPVYHYNGLKLSNHNERSTCTPPTEYVHAPHRSTCTPPTEYVHAPHRVHARPPEYVHVPQSTCMSHRVEYVEGTALVLGFEDPMVRTDDTPVKRCLQTKWPYIELLWTTDRSPSLN